MVLYRHLRFYPDGSMVSPSPASPGSTQGSQGPGITPGHLLIDVPLHSCREASLVTQMVKNPPAMQETRVRSLGREDPLEKGMATHSSILAGKSYGQRSLVGYSPWGRKELDTTERLTLSLSFLQAPVPPHVPGARWQEPGHSRCWRAPSHAAFRQRL